MIFIKKIIIFKFCVSEVIRMLKKITIPLNKYPHTKLWVKYYHCMLGVRKRYKLKQYLSCYKLKDFHGRCCSDNGLLCFYIMQYNELTLPFRRKIMFPSSGVKHPPEPNAVILKVKVVLPFKTPELAHLLH
jgi:hypothetical protein